jgi:hypothetical protein
LAKIYARVDRKTRRVFFYMFKNVYYIRKSLQKTGKVVIFSHVVD